MVSMMDILSGAVPLMVDVRQSGSGPGLIIGALGRLVVPGRQDLPIWLTILIGIVAALIGSLIASALGVGETRGIDWIKLIIQVALAAAGVALVAGRYAPGRKRI
jgi:uncharacterized membrane protein YeaQ/YmgE (transglycosylase-associated protein family)